MADIELLNSPKNIHYEKYDFPVVEVGSSGYIIDWVASTKTELISEITDGISITSENALEFTSEFDDLRKRHGYPNARLDWIDKPNDWHSLECIMPDAGQGIWMYIYSGKGDHADSPMEGNLTVKNRLDNHNIDFSDTAIFLIEGLAHYLRYAGITFPYIQTSIKEIRKENRFGFEREVTDLLYSFELPYDPEFDYKKSLTIYTGNHKIKVLEISDERIALDEKNLATLQLNEKGEKVWKAQSLESSSTASRLFSLLSKPLKMRTY